MAIMQEMSGVDSIPHEKVGLNVQPAGKEKCSEQFKLLLRPTSEEMTYL